MKSQIGIGSECADAITDYQAIQDKNNAETVVPNAETDGNPFYNSSDADYVLAFSALRFSSLLSSLRQKKLASVEVRLMQVAITSLL